VIRAGGCTPHGACVQPSVFSASALGSSAGLSSGLAVLGFGFRWCFLRRSLFCLGFFSGCLGCGFLGGCLGYDFFNRGFFDHWFLYWWGGSFGGFGLVSLFLNARFGLGVGFAFFRVVAGLFVNDTSGFQHARHPVGGLRALVHPMFDPLDIHLHPLFAVFGQQRVVRTEFFDEPAVARHAAVGCNDAVKRAFL